MDILAVVVLAACCLTGLLLVPLGLPGLWVMVLGVLGYGWLTDMRTVGVWTVAIVVSLAFVGELIESWLGFRFAKRYGGSKRAGWGALVGGIGGAIVGVPIPIIGSVIGAFVGSFAGAGGVRVPGVGPGRDGHGGRLGRRAWPGLGVRGQDRPGDRDRHRRSGGGPAGLNDRARPLRRQGV
jgi:uncharacterized protein YqgC (DUF456 family)